MSRAVRQSILQDDFSTGMWAGPAPYLVPDDGAVRLRNVILTDDGPSRRGGTAYKTVESFGEDGLTFLVDARFTAGQRTFFANEDSFGVVDPVDGVTPIDLGGGGLNGPADFVELDGFLWIGGGYLYAGGTIPGPYSTGTVTATNGSAVLTGNGTSWSENVGPGSIIQLGNERVYVVKSVESNTSLTLTENYAGSTGSGKSYVSSAVYRMDGNDPYPISSHYAVVQNRLVWGEFNQIRFSPIDSDGNIQNHQAWASTDFWRLPEGVQITGLEGIGGLLLAFSTAGVWTLSGLPYRIVEEETGNPQHRLDFLSREIVLWGHAGITTFEQRLVVPAIDGVYLLDGISSPVLLTESIPELYTSYVRRGYRLGQAAVYRNHYLLPVIDASGVVAVTLVCRLDRPQKRSGMRVYPWTFFDGDGGRCRAFAVRVDDGRPEPVLLGAQAGTDSRIVDCQFFTPSVAYRLDGDGTAHEMEIITRDFSDGGLQSKHVIRFVRTRYEMSGPDAELHVDFSDGGSNLGGALWDQVKWDEFQWAGSGGANYVPLCTVGISDGRDVHRCRVNKRATFFSYRVRQTGGAAVCRLRSLETEYRPTQAVRQ